MININVDYFLTHSILMINPFLLPNFDDKFWPKQS